MSGKWPTIAKAMARKQVANHRQGYGAQASGRVIVLACLLFVHTSSVYADERWSELKGKHFIIYHKDNERFASKVLSRAEKEYRRITNSLGFSRKSGFWLWEDRARVYLYSNKQEFQLATDAPGWANGRADYKSRTIHGIEGNNIFVDSVLPHEIAHLIFREFIGFDSNVPLWLDEGVAQWEDPIARDKARRAARVLFDQNKLMSLAQITSMDVQTLAESEKAVEFYAQSVSLVGFMIEKYGTQRFTTFCRQLRDGRSMDDALRFTYPQGLRSIKELEVRWSKSLGDNK
ncbi:hypothetical protein BVX97_00720 [bacterium E08(2017)]|nr:hypothetical protein BVX97_00720 [bacterium E08(2017)]